MKRFQNILFVKSDCNDTAAFAQAADLAAQNNAGLTLVKTIAEIRETIYGVPEEMLETLEQEILTTCKEALEHLAKPHHQSVQIQFEILEGIPFISIIQKVLQNGFDLVIKSAEGGYGPITRLFGSADMHLLRKCPCPVWLIKPDQPETVNRIVAAVDFDDFNEVDKNKDLNRQILEMSLTLAHRDGAELHIVHAWSAVGENALGGVRSGLMKEEVLEYVAGVEASQQRHLSELLEQAKGWVGQDIFDAVKPKKHALKGLAHEVVTELTRTLSADLLVMGTVGRTGIPGFIIGNTAETIFGGIDCSVLAIKPAGFVSPVKVS